MKYSVGVLVLISIILASNATPLEKNNYEYKSLSKFSFLKEDEHSEKFASCPNANSILPCLCHENNGANFDCSLVKDNQELRSIFTQPFSANDFRRFVIFNNSALTELTPGDFGSSTFKYIDFTDVKNIAEFNPDIFLNMTKTLRYLMFDVGSLTKFHYDFSEFELLEYVSVDHHSINSFYIISPTVHRIAAEFNNLTLFHFHAYLPNLKMLFLAWNNFETIPCLLGYNHLELLHMSGNPIGKLHWRALCYSDSLTDVYLGSAELSTVRKNSMCIKNESNIVMLRNNDIRTLDQEEFEPIIKNLKSEGLQLEMNPLECGCDIAWIFRQNYQDRITSETTCADGVNFHDLNLDNFNDCA